MDYYQAPMLPEWRGGDLGHVAVDLLHATSFLVLYTTILIGGPGALIYVLVRIVREESDDWIAAATFSSLLLFAACGIAVFIPALCLATLPECLRSGGQLLRLLRHRARASWVWRPGDDGASALPQYIVVQEEGHVMGVPALEHEHRRDGASSQCAVCLGVVWDGETARLLPTCRHMFHQQCIDRWLHHRSTCPLCRCSAFAPPPPPVVQTV
jgi:hypothetical protein